MMSMKRKMALAAAFDRNELPIGLNAGETAYLDGLARLRGGVAAVTADTPEITDAQFSHFMAGIREQLDAPARRPVWGRVWTMASLAAAALLIAVAALSIFYHGPEQVSANKVESGTTEIDGATVDWYDGKEGVTTVWVKTDEGDMW
ncbi:MAG: hypothetical protein GX580_10500 [Candidatus Hydrogenedens sp.]|nr:hypothetical protein [Candidatus Hydrogenedentota bacterium]NLF58056.1 hypothetical protein [Candidatus Hydrogenedens sp.]